ncbi:LamG-like jellyroll fold domain-containing protein [Ancylomarina sp.]|uniref:LamG domain-containing protein n=1 Tax=Ancylomarina sp. TaxID=1970196 RepID=UPI0035636A15
MKTMKLNIKILSFLAAFLMVFTIAACDDDDNLGQVDAASLESLITEAQALINNSQEGTSPGDFKPGSKKELQNVLTWVDWKVANAESQDDVTDAAVKLQVYIDKFKASIVTLAVPIIGQSNDTYILISDNIKPLFNQSFTIETKIYVVDLATKGYSNNIFGTEQSGPDSGFVIRYFGDGGIHLNVGSGSGWNTIESDPGVIKAGEWMHIVFVNEISSQKLYVNGVEVLSQNKEYMPAPEASFVIGNGPTWTDRVINGMIKDFRVWSSARTTAQITDNVDATFENTEADLAMYFPFDADLGNEFKDNTGKYTATFKGEIAWAANGIPPVIVLDFSALNTSIAAATSLKAEVVESSTDGDYPIGTQDYIQALIDDGNDLIANAKKQTEIDEKAASINTKLELVKDNLVADATGIYIDREDSDAVGFRITPNYTPQGDYTVEFDVNIKTFAGYGTGELFNNGNYGIWVYGYEELTEENLLKSGGLWNFTNAGNGWQGPKTDPLVMTPGEWQHVAIVHDNTARTTILYVDGVQKAIQEDIGAPENSGWGETWLGNGWGKMDGSIKDFRRWDVARAAADLNSDIDGTETGLNAYFPLDQVAGIKFKDATGNYDGEMRGIKWNVE